MDYLIAGLGIGAVLAIIGFLLRELGLSHRRSFPRWMADTGAALMVAASIVWVVTAAAFFLGMEDDVALDVVLGTVAVAGLGSIVVAAIMTRSHKPLPTPVAMNQAAPVEEPASNEVVAQEVESGLPAEPEPADSAAAAEKSAVVPAAEKNWEEIWRQTWGSEAVRKLVPEAAIEESAEQPAQPADEAVLEMWEAPMEAESEVEEAKWGPPPEGAKKESAAVPGVEGAEVLAADDEARRESGENVDNTVDADTQVLADSESVEAPYLVHSQNGNDPDPVGEQPAEESNSSNSPNRQPT